MKTFREYLIETTKIYNFKVKVAGDLPENFEKQLKDRLEKYKIVTFEKMKTTPVQQVLLDFPELKNVEVTIFEVILEYPVTSPEISAEIKDIGVDETYFRVRGSGEPSEVDQLQMNSEPVSEPLLDVIDMDAGCGKIKHKDYFGDEFNKDFLKDLAKIAKDRNKSNAKGEYKLPKVKDDKLGKKSAIGS
jgi:hypothetical protein